MAMVYQFRMAEQYPNQFPISAQVAGEALEAMGGHDSGQLTPDAVVDAAREPEHPLHPVFEWDDTIAAGKFRKSQAGELIRAVVAVMPEKPDAKPTRAFVSVKAAAGTAYVPIRTAMSDPELREQVLAGAMRELVSWRNRHRELEELADLFSQVDLFADRHLDDEATG